MKIVGLLMLIVALQGCTLVGAAAESVLGAEKSRNDLVEMGLKADYEIMMGLFRKKSRYSSSEPSNCDDLTGKKKTECRDVAKQVNASIDKHKK